MKGLRSILDQIHYSKLLLEISGDTKLDLAKAQQLLWWNHTDKTNLRLSKYGWKFITQSKIKIYCCELSQPLRSRTLIQLSRFFTCPYYIKSLETIYVLGEQEMVMLQLHANNLQQYLDNQQL